MNKLLIIFKREYLSRVKTKGFIIGTVLTPLFIVLITIGPGLLMSLKSDRVKHLSVVDLSGIIFDEMVATLNDTTNTGARLYELTKVPASIDNLDDVKTDLTQAVEKNSIDGYFIIPPDVVDKKSAFLHAKSFGNFEEIRLYQNVISKIVSNYQIKKSNLDPELVKHLTKPVDLVNMKVTKGGKEEVESGLSFVVTFVMMMFLYMAIIMYGAFVMRSVYEEKLSRVVEVVISSCKPFQLMAGKVLGIGAVGLTQYFIWALVAGLLTVYSSALLQSFGVGNSDLAMPTIPISVLIYFVIFFVLGYLLYATIYAALGAMVNSDQDAQQLQFPVLMLIILAFFISFYITKNPTTNLSLIASLIPFFSPITMFTRIAIQTPPIGEIVLSIVILALTIVFFIWLAGKIFRVGILMYGKRPTLPEVLNWIRY